jgi:CBS domain-containing protein
MTAGDLMTREFRVVHPDASVEEVLRLLQAPGSDPLLVCDGDRLIGMVRHSDVAPRVVAARRRGISARARDVVAEEILFCLETTATEEAVALMQEQGVASLPVLNQARCLVGILALKDVPDGHLTG